MASIVHSAIVASVVACTAATHAQCVTIDFESFAVGASVGDLGDVVVSAVPGSCGGGPGPIIVAPGTGTSSGTRALSLGVGCPDFSPDYMRLVFDDPQRLVTFTLGEGVTPGVSFTVRTYNTAGGLISLSTFSTGSGIYRLVQLGSEGGGPIIKRIEIEQAIGLFETIDDLSYGFDATPPVVRIDEPLYGACVCVPTVSVRGITCDEDGGYGSDMLEFRPANADPGDPWTFVQSYTTPICTSGLLYSWDVGDLSHGRYLLRITTENACGLVSTAVTSVNLSRTGPPATFMNLTDGATVCGIVDIKGTAGGCATCFESYTLERSTGGGGFELIASGSNHIVDGTLGLWDTTDDVLDGVYTLRLTAVDSCGNERVKEVTVFKQDGCACSTDISGNGITGFEDLLQILSNWGPCPS